MSAARINITDLDKATLKKLGLSPSGSTDSYITTVSKVMDAIKGVDRDEAIWSLRQALKLIKLSTREQMKNEYKESLNENQST